MPFYRSGLLALVDGTLDYLTSTVKVMLVSDAYTFDATHDFVSDVVANELSGTGYTGGFAGAGRKTLASKTITVDAANNRIEFDAADAAWTALNAGTLGGAVVIFESVNDAGSYVIAFLDPTNLVTNGSDVTLVWNAEGIMQLPVS